MEGFQSDSDWELLPENWGLIAEGSATLGTTSKPAFCEVEVEDHKKPKTIISLICKEI